MKKLGDCYEANGRAFISIGRNKISDIEFVDRQKEQTLNLMPKI